MKKTQEDITQEYEASLDSEAVNSDNQQQQDTIETSNEDIQMQLLGFMAENQELSNRLLRLQADFENFKRRTRSEKEELSKYANFDLLQKLLPVMDNFTRALDSKEDQGEKILQGVTMIYRQLKDILAKEGLAEIEAVGTEFDPNLHDAVMQEDNEEHAENTVLFELQKGYLYKDKLLRPAMVKVCKR